jgi:tetratricopeptide (TPR) repeat protein
MPAHLIVHRAPRQRRRSWLPYLSFLAGLLIVFAALGSWMAFETVPTFRYHAETLWGQVRDVVAPHSDVLPTPVLAAEAASQAPVVLPPPLDTAEPAATPTASPSPAATLSGQAATPGADPTGTPTPIPLTPTALPASYSLSGITHVYQKFNNCGPASLTEELSYWGWQGTQADAAQVLKPNQDDKNVSPAELYAYLLTQGFDAYIRMGGNLDLLKRFIAAGYPPLVEKGFDVPGKGWMGHYGVISAYDDQHQVFTIQDTFLGPDTKMTYADFERNWRAFNFIYLVVFPAGKERDAEVVSLLGEMADLGHSYQVALARAQAEAPRLTGQDAAFAWFNVGTTFTYLQNYGDAATAYDRARKIGLPYRMLWYQFGPYRSYYMVGRYQDIIDLATFAIDSANIPAIEESYYWRGLAQQALGRRDSAIGDYRQALKQHPGYKLAADALTALGAAP